jgi:simple sugar transport system permease protein
VIQRYGTIVGVVSGTFIYGVVSAGLFYTGWNTVYAQVIIGALLVIAVLTNKYLQNLALRGNRLKGAR